MGIARTIFHMDMDAFYASVEQRDNASLRGQPVIVGSPPGQRGVVCAASYEARRFGIRSAMPSSTAGRLCPQGIFVRPRMEHYRAESRAVMGILRAVLLESGQEPQIECMSIDEAYIDATDLLTKEPFRSVSISAIEGLSAVSLARRIKHRIVEERQLTATIGIASNKLLAKLASDFRKPDGLTWVPDADRALFLRPLPVRALYGVGPVTANVLRAAGVELIADLQDFPGNLRPLLGSFAESLRRYSFGEDDRPVESGEEARSISAEETFLRDTSNRPALQLSLRELAADIADRLGHHGVAAHTVQVKVRYANFVTLSRQVTLEEPVATVESLYRIACSLLRRNKLVSQPLRLLGLSVSALTDSRWEQLSLWRETVGGRGSHTEKLEPHPH